MKVKISTLIGVALIGLTGCNTSPQQNTAESAQKETQTVIHTSLDSNSVFGTYSGTFPCADCGGKDVTLTICKDSTYCLKYKYQDKDEREIEENGVYSILNGTLVETTTPSSGIKTYYRYVHGNLVLSDSLGTVNNGELAEMYVLKKNEIIVK